MTLHQARALLDRIRDGDRSPGIEEITEALRITGDIA